MSNFDNVNSALAAQSTELAQLSNDVAALAAKQAPPPPPDEQPQIDAIATTVTNNTAQIAALDATVKAALGS